MNVENLDRYIRYCYKYLVSIGLWGSLVRATTNKDFAIYPYVPVYITIHKYDV